MARVRTGPTRRRRHQKMLDRAKGYRKTRSKAYKRAKEARLHAGEYAFAGRRLRKRDFRRLWITRINAAVRQFDLTYSEFVHLLKKSKISLNRKMLAEIAVRDPETFANLVKRVQPS